MNVTKPSVEIIDMKDYDEMIRKIEKIGRVCYKSEGNITEESAERFIRNILKRGHESVIEHEAVMHGWYGFRKCIPWCKPLSCS